MEKVWLITGCSTGFGRELAKQVLELGYKAGVAARNIADVEDIVKQYPETSIAITLDVTRQDHITDAVKQLTEIFGRVDVLVNNAGIGYFGSVEASDEHETRRMFDINFFGLANMTKAVLPHMRKQRSGHIINIASIGGLMAFPALAYYNATKFAVDGFSESLAKETAPLGIKVTIVAPSGFRTDWAGRSANEVQNEIEDYKTTAGANKDNIRAYNGNQPGDPVRAAQAIIKVVETENPPLRLLLGAAALKNARKKIEELAHDFDAWEETTVGADFPKP
ncbi:oxidoreductase [Pedobacter panaciterrae]|jgi:Short-chain dehydrogenases of various substrate specificities|uniref:Oxidoreductase n=1 Tax=Pedobacter panaciterrae TaxID=363849 RepID=A0ABU8NGB3_9SPHI|nr:oxidoreductase [Pedobacter panaciterrae]NQX56540.1 SDR family NAD(P)-dependent oxidoreductase [Pedobacter panaciterrae]